MSNLHASRLTKYSSLSLTLASLSNKRLKQILAEAKPLHEGIGGKSMLIFIDKTPVFVKKLPLTELETLPQNFMSTANIFDLPLCYQYGVGSAGFRAFRELATHIMTTSWILTGKWVSFPITYHWRILKLEANETTVNSWQDIDKYCAYWENSTAIRKRVEGLNAPVAHLFLFLEYVPQNLYEWLSAKIAKGGNTAKSAIKFVDKHIRASTSHMNAEGLLHFDAHFYNILTDGALLYFSDFGLALSSKFDLSKEEFEFLKNHQSYDQACIAVNLLHCIITSLWGTEQWESCLRKYLAGSYENVTPVIRDTINRYGAIALIMDEFFQKLQKESKSTPYPKTLLEKLLLRVLETS